MPQVVCLLVMAGRSWFPVTHGEDVRSAMGVGDLQWVAALAPRNARRKLGDRAFPIGRAPIATRPSRWIPGNAGVPRG
jgi:hypothetical protein